RLRPLAGDGVGGLADLLLEGLPDAVAQLGGGRVGEGDGRDVGERHPLDEHEVGDAPHERGGLAGACARLDEQGATEAGARDEVADVLVDGHASTSASAGSGGSNRARTASCGAATFASAWVPRWTGHTRSKSQNAQFSWVPRKVSSSPGTRGK